MPVIEVKSLEKKYQKNFFALKNLTFSVEEGEFISIVGTFGCGKSTLLEILSGLRTDYDGVVKINDKSPKEAILKRKIGYVFQRPVLLPWRNVIQNIALPLEIEKKQNNQEAYNLLEMIELSHLAEKKIYELSGGMQQLISIARSLVLKPDVLLLDEPFSSIDEISRVKMHLKLLKIHKKTQKTILLVTHSLSEAVFLSKKIIVMTPNPGKVKKIINIALPSRDENVLFSKCFSDYVKNIREELKNDKK